MINIENIIAIILAYLIGSIPSSVWIGRIFFGIDVREHGSGNAGATNTLRVLGNKAGITVLVLDALKGWMAVHLSHIFGNNLTGNYFVDFQLILALFAVLGHVFPVFVGFRGGKGIATLMGIVIAMFPGPVLISISIFLIVFLSTRYVSLGSIITAITFPFIVYFVFDIRIISLIVFSILISIFVPITHRNNIKRLIKGKESKISFKKDTKKDSINKEDNDSK